jgi:hypothetical protein
MMATTAAPAPRPPENFLVELTGHLTEAALTQQLGKVRETDLLSVYKPGLIVDCRAMTGYDAQARELFTVWNARHRHRLMAVAVITENRLWHMILATMSMASKQQIKPFSRVQDAQLWLSRLRKLPH